MTVAVIGAGNFGTVIANIVAGNGYDTTLWMRDESQLTEMLECNENRRYLPGYPLHEKIRSTTDIAAAVGSSQLVFVTVPSHSFREVAQLIGNHLRPYSHTVSATKGIEQSSFKLMSEILREELPPCSIGILSGPNLAEEIARGMYAGTVIASGDRELISVVQDTLSSKTFRVYSSTDTYGVELAGALKNIYAIICGVASALNLGQNTASLVMTRGLVEMSRFAEAMKGNRYTFLGLSGVGDLVATCTSPHSRNYQLGVEIATGMSLEEAMNKLGKLAEGVYTLQAVYERKKSLDIYMPLVDGLYRVLIKGESLQSTIDELMTSEQREDVEFNDYQQQ